jgi:hypothetical protein
MYCSFVTASIRPLLEEAKAEIIDPILATIRGHQGRGAPESHTLGQDREKAQQL